MKKKLCIKNKILWLMTLNKKAKTKKIIISKKTITKIIIIKIIIKKIVNKITIKIIIIIKILKIMKIEIKTKIQIIETKKSPMIKVKQDRSRIKKTQIQHNNLIQVVILIILNNNNKKEIITIKILIRVNIIRVNITKNSRYQL